jgi:hypothetical protein
VIPPLDRVAPVPHIAFMLGLERIEQGGRLREAELGRIDVARYGLRLAVYVDKVAELHTRIEKLDEVGCRRCVPVSARVVITPVVIAVPRAIVVVAVLIFARPNLVGICER